MENLWETPPSATDVIDPRTAAGIEALGNLRSIDFTNLTHEQINELGRSVNLLSDDPRNLWKSFRFYIRMLRSGKVYEAVGLMREGNVRFRLRESWLALHCTDVDEPDVYREIDGEDGYGTYMEYATSLKAELARVQYYEDVVKGEVAEDSPYAGVVTALFKEYVPGENW